MRFAIAMLAFTLALTAHFAMCQQGPEASKGRTSAEFGDLKCRADSQKWTTDPFDAQDPRNLSSNRAVWVNGQFRSIPSMTPHLTVKSLLERAHEMEVCTREDADFEKQFGTYSAMAKAYNEEHCARYSLFVIRHHLDEQFVKEDAEENK